jgi:hypothetical protein
MPARDVELASRLWAWLQLVGVVVLLLVVAKLVPPDLFAPVTAVPVVLVLGYFEWRRLSGFFAVRIMPTHIELRYLIGERRIARHDALNATLRVDAAGIVDRL